MKIPRSVAEFRKWLLAEIADLDDPCPEEYRFREAVQVIRNAGRIAVSLELPEVAAICDSIRTPAYSLAHAQRLLLRCVNALDPDDALTVREAAGRLKCSERTVYTLVRSGRLHAQRLGNGRGTIRIAPADLQNIGPTRKLRHL